MTSCNAYTQRFNRHNIKGPPSSVSLPVVTNDFLVLLLPLASILGQLPDAFAASIFHVVLPEQPDLLLIQVRVRRKLSNTRELDLKVRQNQPKGGDSNILS